MVSSLVCKDEGVVNEVTASTTKHEHVVFDFKRRRSKACGEQSFAEENNDNMDL